MKEYIGDNPDAVFIGIPIEIENKWTAHGSFFMVKTDIFMGIDWPNRQHYLIETDLYEMVKPFHAHWYGVLNNLVCRGVFKEG